MSAQPDAPGSVTIWRGAAPNEPSVDYAVVIDGVHGVRVFGNGHPIEKATYQERQALVAAIVSLSVRAAP